MWLQYCDICHKMFITNKGSNHFHKESISKTPLVTIDLHALVQMLKEKS